MQDLAADSGKFALAFAKVDVIHADVFIHKLPGAVASYHNLWPVFLDERMVYQSKELGAVMRRATTYDLLQLSYCNLAHWIVVSDPYDLRPRTYGPVQMVRMGDYYIIL
ncbi:MAG: hypothetical protein A4E49_01205 [Methanosaeta sp. PtaU1.Bin112]|nr:MAG: hypothetical protein A4E49_01205 [Methanosaeta sp. PtaU1.Bin112]